MRPQEAVRKCFIFPKQAQQEMFGFNVRLSELARLVAREKDHAPRLFCIAFEHTPPSNRRSALETKTNLKRGARSANDDCVATVAFDCDGED